MAADETAGSAAAQALGIDVSHIQGDVDWTSVLQAGYVFAFIKATEGETVVDPMFSQNWSGAEEAGLLRGAYHFFHAEDSPQTQAELFWKTVGENGELPLVVDVEQEESGITVPATDVVTANLTDFLALLQQMSGRQPMIYTNRGYWDALETTAFEDYPLWLADYVTNWAPGSSPPSLPTGWNTWAFWQHSESGQVPGISKSTDLNVFNGSLDALRLWPPG